MSIPDTLAFAGALVIIALSTALNVWYLRRRRPERPVRTWQIAVAATILVFAVTMAVVELR